MFCEICKNHEVKFVRDHNHKTGFIRGILCNPCNSYLGTYEKVSEGFPALVNSKKYLIWKDTYKKDIDRYLSKKDTTFKYSGSIKIQLKDLERFCI